VNKKEAKKTLILLARARATARGLDEKKFFASFFQKRSASLLPSCRLA
jgi:hypothetical protein